MKTYSVNIYGKNIEVIQNDDGTFQRPSILDEWKGFGTSAKPAHEPICMARKPLAEKTVSENVLKWGTGGINIDESRVESNEVIETGRAGRSGASNFNASIGEEQPTHSKRFPANLIHDNSEEVRECFPETKSGAMNGTYKGSYDFLNDGIVYGKNANTQNREKSEGNASRFFKSILYYPKASKSERNKGCEEIEKGCFHPTVKPIALMEYLIKMVTKEGGIVLDPFAGSGTTLVAAKKNGYQYVGCELTEEYIPIIEARLNATEEEIEEEGPKEISLFA